MTRCILPTDIEPARKLWIANRPDTDIVTALVQRGIDSASAAQLVADLRDGRKVEPQIPAGLEIAPGRRSRSRKAARPGEPGQPSRVPEPTTDRGEPAEREAESGKNSSALWLIAAVPVCFVAVVIGVLISNRLHRADEDPQPGKPRTVAPARESASPAGSSQGMPRASTPAGSLPAASGQAAAPKSSTGAVQKLTGGISNAPVTEPHRN